MMDQYQRQLEEKARQRTQFGRSVFISYSRTDEAVAQELGSLLAEMEIPYFLDQKDIDWGDQVTDALKDGLRRCTHLLLVVSSASLESSWVSYEIGQADAQGKFILPYLTNASLNLPGFISGRNYKSTMAEVRQFFDSPEPGAEELASTFSSVLSFFPSDLAAYEYCTKESSTRKEVWRSASATPMPGRGGDGYGRVVIDAATTPPAVQVSFNEKGASYLVHSRRTAWRFDQENQQIVVSIRDVNNDGDVSDVSDRIEANSTFWERLVEMLRSHIRDSVQTTGGQLEAPSEGEPGESSK